MLFKDREIRDFLANSPPSTELLARLANVPARRKQEMLFGPRSIWLARELLVALASQRRFAAFLARAFTSLPRDELVTEAGVPLGLATETIRLLASWREAESRSVAQEMGCRTDNLETVARHRFPPDPLVRLADAALIAADAPGAMPASPPDLCLNAWFPDEPSDVPRLIVGVAARLHVNLGPPRAGAAGSEVLPNKVVQELSEVPFVDVLLLCAGADIKPLRQRLPMPPDPKRVLQFTLIARRPGELDIQIVLLVHNEPIHRMSFPVTAVTRSDTAAATTGSQL
jgi:hypothetical protein